MNTVKIVGTLNKIRWQSDDGYKIVTIDVSECLSGDLKTDKYGWVVFKGNLSMMYGTEYILVGEELEAPNGWGYQYDVVSCTRTNPVEKMSQDEFKCFLEEIASQKQVEAIYDALSNVKETFENGDFETLTRVKGIGPATADKLLAKYNEQRDLSLAYPVFSKWGFKGNIVKKCVDFLGGIDRAIEKVQENPYVLMHCPGLGFISVDTKVLLAGMKVNDPRRVNAMAQHCLDQEAVNGSSFMYLEDLLSYLKTEVYACDIDSVLNHLKTNDVYSLFTRDDRECVALTRLITMEDKIATKLKQMVVSPMPRLNNIETIIQTVEEEQGFIFSDEQHKAIIDMVSNHVFLLQGLAGTGKSSTINAVVKIFKENCLSIAQCALSGKAADNLSQITGLKGSTIHRLLGSTGEKFEYNADNKLPYKVIIVDEISMVDVQIFYSLLSALADDSILIMVGDNGQLDSIGCDVMNGIMKSAKIPSTILQKVHRQALDSAIIEHSLLYRSGKVPPRLTNDIGSSVYGNKRDMGYYFVDKDNESMIGDIAVKAFKKALTEYKVSQIQIISPTNEAGIANCFNINHECQKLISAPKGTQAYEFKIGKDKVIKLRVNDRVINIKNNKRTTDVTGEKIIPIFNGNVGTITDIVVDGEDVSMVVDFDGIGEVLLNNVGDIKNLRLGYAITIHKSQGSTIPFVIIALPFQFKLDSRELLYTAITRAKDRAYMITSHRTLSYATKKTSKKERKTNLDMLLIKRFA